MLSVANGEDVATGCPPPPPSPPSLQPHTHPHPPSFHAHRCPSGSTAEVSSYPLSPPISYPSPPLSPLRIWSAWRFSPRAFIAPFTAEEGVKLAQRHAGPLPPPHLKAALIFFLSPPPPPLPSTPLHTPTLKKNSAQNSHPLSSPPTPRTPPPAAEAYKNPLFPALHSFHTHTHQPPIQPIQPKKNTE